MDRGGTGNGRTSPSQSMMLPSSYNLTIAHEKSRAIFLRGGSVVAPGLVPVRHVGVDPFPFPFCLPIDTEVDDGIREFARSFSRSTLSLFRVSARTTRVASKANSGTRRRCESVKPKVGPSSSSLFKVLFLAFG